MSLWMRRQCRRMPPKFLISRPGRVCRQIRGPWRKLLRMSLDLLHQQVDGLLQLRVMAFHYQVRPILHGDVRFHAAIFNQPLTIQRVERELGPRNIAAVDERNLAADTPHAAPGALADDWSELVLLKKVSEEVSVRRGVVI